MRFVLVPWDRLAPESEDRPPDRFHRKIPMDPARFTPSSGTESFSKDEMVKGEKVFSRAACPGGAMKSN
ncbi:hypothetical protein [Haloferula sargassicola]|uniref:hypothetical protein n=1 Tax=Haloferula sargassicola TaxID=490096 RepID=UPI0033658EC7